MHVSANASWMDVVSPTVTTWPGKSLFTVVGSVAERTEETRWKAGQHRVAMWILRKAHSLWLAGANNRNIHSINSYLLINACQGDKNRKKKLSGNSFPNVCCCFFYSYYHQVSFAWFIVQRNSDFFNIGPFFSPSVEPQYKPWFLSSPFR